MVDIIEIAVLGAILAVVVFIGTLLGTLLGAIAGWIIGITPLGGMVLHVLDACGVGGISMVEFGAALGFIGGFFGSRVSTNN